MDLLETIIPKKDGWIIKNDTIYKSKIQLISIARFIDGDLWIVLDKSVYRESVEVIENCRKNSVNFYLTTPRLINSKHIYQEDLNEIIYNYLSHLMDKKWYTNYSQRVDLIKLLPILLDDYKCLHLLDDAHELVKKQNQIYWWQSNKAEVKKKIDDFDSNKRKLKIEMIRRKSKV